MLTRLLKSILICSCVIGSLTIQGMQAMRRFLTPRSALLRPAMPRQQIAALTAKSFKKPFNLRNPHLPTQVKTVHTKTSCSLNTAKTKPQTESNQSSWWQRFSSFCSSSFQSALHRVRSLNPFARRTALLGGTALTAASLIKANNETVEFTKQNIDAHPELKDAFIEQAQKDITAQDQAIIEAILHLLEKYPETALKVGNEVAQQFIFIHPKIFEKVVVGIKDDAALCKIFSEKTAAKLKTTFNAFEGKPSRGEVYKCNCVFTNIPQAIGGAVETVYAGMKDADYDSKLARTGINLVAQMPALLPNFLRISLEKENIYVYDFVTNPQLMKDVEKYLAEHPDQDYLVHPKCFSWITSGIKKACNYYDTLNPDLKAIFNILKKNVHRPEIMNEPYNALYYFLGFNKDPEFTQHCVEQFTRHFDDKKLQNVFVDMPSSYRVVRKSEYLLEWSKSSTLKDAILDYVSDPAVFASLPPERAQFFYEYIKYPDKTLTERVRTNITKPAFFAKASPELIKKFVKEDQTLIDSVAQLAVTTDNKVIQNIMSSPKDWRNPDACAQHSHYLKDKVLEQAQDLKKVHETGLDVVHAHADAEQQRKIEDFVQTKVNDKTTTMVDRALNYFDTFKLLTKCTDKNHGDMPTEQHYCTNRDTVMAHFNRAKEKLTPGMRSLFSSLFKKEQEEVAKGNYVFYHGQRWPWHFKSDIYKEFVKLSNPQDARDDFQFLRFGNNREYNWYYVRDALFMNGALFANALRDGNCTFHYLLENHDFSNDRDRKFSSAWMADQFKMKPYYEQHKQEFDDLEKLHNSASKNGNCLLLSVPSDKVDQWIYPADARANKVDVWKKNYAGWISGAKEAIDTIRTKPQTLASNDIQYAMPMEGDVLDPHKGPRIYSFNNADQKIMAEYATKRDKLFASIRQEMIRDGLLPAPEIIADPMEQAVMAAGA